jgi:hypothetical protein
MPAKGSSRIGTVVAVLFSSVVAPMIVKLVEPHLDGGESSRVHRTVSPTPGAAPARPVAEASTERVTHPVVRLEAPQPLEPPAPVVPALAVTRVIVRGSGKTPEEALQHALDAGVARAIAAHVYADTWARQGPSLCAGARRHQATVVRAWKDLGTKSERKLFGTVVHQEAAVDVDDAALDRHLRALLAEATPHRPTPVAALR